MMAPFKFIGFFTFSHGGTGINKGGGGACLFDMTCSPLEWSGALSCGWAEH